MQNSYIVDAFLSGVLLMITSYLVYEVRARLAGIEYAMSPQTLAIAISQLARRIVLFSAPFIIGYVFLLWRFYALMLASQTWGYGGMGLLVMMLLLGAGLILLHVMLVSVARSPFYNLALLNKSAERPDSRGDR